MYKRHVQPIIQFLIVILLIGMIACLIAMKYSSTPTSHPEIKQLQQEISLLKEDKESKELWIGQLQEQISSLRYDNDALEKRVTTIEESLERLSPMLNEAINSNAPS